MGNASSNPDALMTEFDSGMKLRDSIGFTINGKTYQVKAGDFPATYKLSSFLRYKALLTGTKTMCKEGGCGACTVSVCKRSGESVMPINSCLVPIYACNGWNIVTIEGIGSGKKGYHKIQQTLADSNGSQCGYCSPGMVMTMYGSAAQMPSDIKTNYEANFDGNICRCTGYRFIMDAMKKCAESDIEDLQKCNGCPLGSCAPKDSDGFAIAADNKYGSWCVMENTWCYPASLLTLRQIIVQFPKDSQIVVGSTGAGVYKNDAVGQMIIDVSNIESMHQYNQSDGVTVVGAAVTLTTLQQMFVQFSSQTGFSYLKEAARYLGCIANLQVRNAGCWAGNLMLKYHHHEFVSDVFVLLESIGAVVNIYDCLADKFITVSPVGLLQTDMTGKYIESMTINAKTGYVLQTFKVMPRYRNAHTYMSLGLFATIDSNGVVTEKPNVVYTGVGKEFAHAEDLENYLVQKKLVTAVIAQGLIDKFSFDNDDELPSTDSRKKLAKLLLHKAALSLCPGQCDPSEVSGGQVLERPLQSSGTTIIHPNPGEFPLTEPIPKLDSIKQTSGESQYIDDMPEMSSLLHAAFVTATIGNGEVESIDASQAEEMAGVERVLTYKDIPGENKIYSFSDSEGYEPLLVEKTVSYYGQPVAIVLADSHDQALAARDKVQVKYTNSKPPIVTIQQAIDAKSFFASWPKSNISQGDAKGAMTKSDAVVNGSVEVGEQYAMHMETQVCLVDPQEGYYMVYSATQVMSLVRSGVARLLGIGSNLIDVRVRRLGGGFGNKQTRSIVVAAAAAFGAFVTERPVKMVLTLDDNMAILGKRNPFKINYQLGVDKSMKIQSIIATVYENCGYITTETAADVMASLLDNAYYIPNWDIKVLRCKTNQPTHCFTRAPGTLSASHLTEQILDHACYQLQVQGEAFREANFYQDGQATPTGIVISPCRIQQLWDQLKTTSDFAKREADIATFNQANKYRKKGIAMMPLKYQLSFVDGLEYLVHVMINDNDGTVTIIPGGVEIGQGLNTKVIQIAAKTLNISLDIIKVQPSSSVVNLHSVNTGGSTTSDMNCVGVQRACEILLQRLEPFKSKATDWMSLIKLSRDAFTDLHAKYHITNRLLPDKTGEIITYNVFGTACSEVELDCLTGNFLVNRVDLLYDAGESYSPMIDLGQIEGAFIMGLGLFFQEEIKYDPETGRNITTNTWNYKVPMNRDIPVEFNVELADNLPNEKFSLRSKTEPPLLLSESAVLALRKAVVEARKTQGNSEFVFMNAPFTVDKVFMACNP